MAIVKCHECGKDVSTEAASCPNCGAKPKKKQDWLQILGVIILAGGFLAWLGTSQKPTGGPTYSADTTPVSSRRSEAQAQQQDIYRTSAIELFLDYDRNEVATDDRLRGKVVEVNGIIQAIDKDFTDSLVIRLATPNEFMPATFDMLESEKPKAATLNKGQPINIRCKKILRFVGSPAGHDCVFVEPPPEAPVVQNRAAPLPLVSTDSPTLEQPAKLIDQPQATNKLTPSATPTAPAAAAQATPPAWYYCASPPGYYPYVRQCSVPWQAVQPSAQPASTTQQSSTPLFSAPVQPVVQGASAAGPSFDCAQSTTNAERLICSSKELSQADVQMVTLYDKALETSDNKMEIRRQQNDWRHGTRDACADVQCLQQAYRQRITELGN